MSALESYRIGEVGVTPLTIRVGAEIENVKLGGDVSDETVSAIKAALLKHKVVFFRDQTHLSDAEHEAFTKRLGELVPHPTNNPIAGTESIVELDSTGGLGRADQWHSDVTFVEDYLKYGVLRGVVIPPVGGDTIWANTHTAYENLPEPLKILADSLWAIHSNAYDYAAVRVNATSAETQHYQKVFTATVYETEHPVVRVHPETGERTLVLGNFVQRLVGLNKSDTAKLVDLFQSYITSPENTVRWHWKNDDVAIWDNRATQHIAVNDYGDQRRVVRRAAVAGEVPVSTDGRNSVTRVKFTKPQVDAA